MKVMMIVYRKYTKPNQTQIHERRIMKNQSQKIANSFELPSEVFSSSLILRDQERMRQMNEGPNNRFARM